MDSLGAGEERGGGGKLRGKEVRRARMMAVGVDGKRPIARGNSLR